VKTSIVIANVVTETNATSRFSDSGYFSVSPRNKLRQQRLDIGASSDLLDWFLERSGQSISEGRSVLAKFGLSARHLARPPSSLSTGERTRAELALFQARGVNLLILDEPTNHLDLEAIEQLETALAGYEGTLIVVSHDRRFVEHLDLTRTMALG
jgi:ATPase subunit of ABC transporter with duplicated ATPase domains